jgi:putative FmdB family regulatory protein
MPTYEYKCSDCNTPYSKVRGITEPEVEYYCEVCKSTLLRVYSKPVVNFSGSGFYSTDK